MKWWPFASWLISAAVDIAFDPRWKPESTPEQISTYGKVYFAAVTAMNVAYAVAAKDVVGGLVAQAGYMVGVEDVLYFDLKRWAVPDSLPYLPFYMDTKEKLWVNSAIMTGVALLV